MIISKGNNTITKEEIIKTGADLEARKESGINNSNFSKAIKERIEMFRAISKKTITINNLTSKNSSILNPFIKTTIHIKTC